MKRDTFIDWVSAKGFKGDDDGNFVIGASIGKGDTSYRYRIGKLKVWNEKFKDGKWILLWSAFYKNLTIVDGGKYVDGWDVNESLPEVICRNRGCER